MPIEWSARYGLRSEQTRLPKDTSIREVLARQIEADGYQLLEWVLPAAIVPGLKDLPVLEAHRQI